MKKSFCLCVFILFVICGLFAQEKQIRVGVLNGPSCIPAAYMMDKNKTINEAAVSYEKYADAQTLLPKLIKKEVDIGFLPVNVAAKVYNSTNKAIICCGITGNGNISLITTDKSIRHFSDLKGHTVSVAGQGATPDYMFQYLLAQNDVATGDGGVILDYSTPNAQIAARLILGKTRYAVVPEPFTTVAKSKSSNVISALNFQTEYAEFNGKEKDYPLTVMVVRKVFAEENKELLNAFLKDYETSYKWTVSNPSKAGLLSEKYDLGLSAQIVSKAIPDCNYTYVPAAQAQKQVETLLKIFLEYDKNSFGGALPETDFYYKGE